MTDIPVVDFSAMSLDNKDPLSENDQAIRIVANEVYRAFSTTGFVYLKNHGISKETVSTEQNSKFNSNFRALYRKYATFLTVLCK